MQQFQIESLLAARQFVHPQIVGDRIYFISDLSGRLSLYVMDVGGSAAQVDRIVNNGNKNCAPARFCVGVLRRHGVLLRVDPQRPGACARRLR